MQEHLVLGVMRELVVEDQILEELVVLVQQEVLVEFRMQVD
jgi:hypothetical protein